MRETKTTTLSFIWDVGTLVLWLERQAEKGWYLEEIRRDGLTARFRRGEPGPVRYRGVPAQEKTLSRETIEEYEDFGWTYMGRFRELYHVFCTQDPAAPEIYTDEDSLPVNFRRTIRKKAVWVVLLLGLGLLNFFLRVLPVSMGWTNFVKMSLWSPDFFIGVVWLLITLGWGWQYGSAWWYSRRAGRGVPGGGALRRRLGLLLPWAWLLVVIALLAGAFTAPGRDQAVLDDGTPDQWAEPMAWLPTEGETAVTGTRYAYPLAPAYTSVTSQGEDLDNYVTTICYRLRWPWLSDRIAADMRDDLTGQWVEDPRVANLWYGVEEYTHAHIWLLWEGDRMMIVSGSKAVTLEDRLEDIMALWQESGSFF